MIFLLGATGYIGTAFERELTRRRLPHKAISRKMRDYSNFNAMRDILRSGKIELVINCAGFTGKPNVDACETQRSSTILGNIVLAQTVAQACEVTGTRLATISSGCIYAGTKVQEANGSWKIREDLNAPDLAGLLSSRSPRIRGFDEDDAPNFTFENNSSFYSGTKAVEETVLRQFPDHYIWRLRLPFAEHDNPRNYLTKLQSYPKLYQNWNSLTHLGDFAAACLQIAEQRLPGGAYTIVNPGYTCTKEVVALIRKLRKPDWQPAFFENDAEFYQQAARARRSNCILETGKLTVAGIKLRDVETALVESLRDWR